MEENITTNYENIKNKTIIRRQLLPIWMKVFCWIFMIMGIAAIACLIYGAFGNKADLSMYGYQTNEPISFLGFFIISIIIIKAFAAYSLWFEKENAISIAKFDAMIGFIVCIIALFYFPLVNQTISIRLEILFIIPYFQRLNKIEYAWINLEEQ